MPTVEPLEDLGVCLVTGAAGFLGSHLVRGLLDQGYSVRAVVRRTALPLEHPELEIVRGEMEDAERMMEICRGVDTVFHAAAHLALLGGSAASAKYRKAAYEANVRGVENLIAACQANGVSRFVHTSSIDVCFNSEVDTEMNELTPYASNMSCLYTETKIEGEKRVLEANGQGGLLTTVLRPDGIYGPGNNLMLDEMFEQVTKGRLVATIGYPGALHDHIYIDNLVDAEIRIAKRLVAGSPVCGKAYFVTDGRPLPLFEFMRPLIEGMGYKVPKLDIPYRPVLAFLRLWQYLHFRIGLPAPFFSPHEIRKLAISHCASSAAAERDFDYRPIVSPDDAMARCLAHYRERLASVRALAPPK
ncbi:MAG TPA: NAD-dependent epimerase/dehydratase family protein [Polyangiales bacterium]|jgi:3beta-hydroxy-delta5-steroid dehydrogenase/steroid delta-isomerase|nr:NAD-dependent epimerase/dehydratase family protein [Polyangiales bacterium]